MKRRYLCVCLGRSLKHESIVHATSKRRALANWLSLFRTVDFIEAQEGDVKISCERILTEAELRVREDTPLAEPESDADREEREGLESIRP